MINYKILDWDSAFLGYKVAMIEEGCMTPIDFNNCYNDLLQLNVKLLYWPSDFNCIYQESIINEHNGLLVDVKTTYELKIDASISDQAIPLADIKFYQNEEANVELLNLAVQCGEYSRFKLDPNITFNKFAELYSAWMIKSVQGTMADDVIVVKENNQIKGVITVYIENSIGNIGLVGVDEQSRGKGIGGKLIKAALGYFIHKGCETVRVVTQGKNEAACKLYEKYGFYVCNKVNFYHFWL